MLVSVFTPTHNPRFLAECFKSLTMQTHREWEWIIVPNGEGLKAATELAKSFAEQDERVRVFPYAGESKNIGCLKRMACEVATGELLMEYDHDDTLTRECLAEIVKAYKRVSCGQPVFIYSDDAALNADGTSNLFGTHWGWEHYDWNYRGKSYGINRGFDITPRSLCEILYCPDHVRVWNRIAYERSGGHDPNLPVADDHLLMIKTYLCGAEFVKLAEPVYFYRVRKDNTCVPRVNEIQALSRQHRDIHLRDLIHEWVRRNDYPMYDLGGAHGCPKDYLPIDPHLPEGVPGLSKSVFEVDFEPNSVAVFRAHDFLEHIPSTQIPALMNKLYDALMPGGWILTQTPSTEDSQGRVGRGADQDPTHVSRWNTNSTWYYTNRNQAQYVPEIRCRFQSVCLGYFFPSKWHEQHRIPYMRWDACALKDGNRHWPGEKLI